MEKFRTFLKRSGALMSVLVLLLCCTVPASAAAPTSTKVAPIFFDEIGILYGEAFERSYRMPWPGNILGPANQGTSYSQYKDDSNTSDNYLLITGVDQLDNGIVRSHYHLAYDYTGWGVGLFNVSGTVIEEGLLSDSQGYNVAFSHGTVGVSGRVSIAFTAAKINQTSDSYSVTTKSFSASNLDFGEDGVDLMDLIDTTLTDYTYREGEYVYLTNLSVRFFLDDLELTDVLMHVESVGRSSPSTYAQWFSQYNLIRSVVVNPADPSGVDFVDWLTIAVSGFLDFELWPGMSLSQVLWVILVVGVMFWFLKLTV